MANHFQGKNYNFQFPNIKYTNGIKTKIILIWFFFVLIHFFSLHLRKMYLNFIFFINNSPRKRWQIIIPLEHILETFYLS